jgi:DNA-binding NtrC family response regulator
LIQATLEEALSEPGFGTAVASPAEKAVTLLQANVMNYRALVTDINLKGRMNGCEVAKQARVRNFEFAIVYMTGSI